MPRPEKNNVDYFPFICRSGKKMYYIEQKYKNDGFAVFVKLLRALAESDYHYIDLSNIQSLSYMTAVCCVDEDKLRSIINDLSMLGKFNTELWTENSIIWCQDFIDNIQDAYIKRKNKCITFDGLLLHLDSLGVRKLSKSKLNVVKNTHTILDNTIVDNIKPKKGLNKRITSEVKIPEFDEFKKYALENKPDADIESVRLKYKSWTEADWTNGNGKKIINWKSTLLNTLPYIKTAINNNNAASGGKPKINL